VRLYLGLLGAARVSRAALATDEGIILAHIVAPPLTICVNVRISLYLQETFERLAKEAGITFKAMVNDLSGACVAMSGLRSESDQAALKQILNKIGFSGSFRLVTCRDTNAHLAANFLTHGGLVIASTGSIVILRGRGMANPIRVDGWGSVLGDEGGGYDLGTKCLRAILKGNDGRMTRSSVLERKVLEHIGLNRVEDILPWYYSIRETVNWRLGIADIAIPLIEAAEKDEDNIARELVTDGACSLLKSFEFGAESATKLRDKFIPEPVPLILEGGIFQHSTIYIETFTSLLSTRVPSDLQWKAENAKYQPVVGALALALSGGPYIEGELAKYDSMRKSAAKEGLRIEGNILSSHGS